ncbi:MAG: 7-cyano-7-deazaguanine synthase QueC [Synechococcales cyanobacterium RM1_1_8]|nr:7-cyano-7-deazaguanine synthase QueC [Synechococcales cyanobacterium RM1_1_8]
MQSSFAPYSPSTKPRAIVLLSGGLDSATAAAQAAADGFELIALSCRYGQRHIREIGAAQALAKQLDCLEHHIVDVNLNQWGGSSLTDLRQSLPLEGELSETAIPSTYVPGRNTVFIALALSLAETRQATAIYLGINAVDYSGYPDCRPDYLAAYQKLANLSSKAALEGKAPELRAPLVYDSKVDIVHRAIALGVPIESTWSCYAGHGEPCGRCDSCRIRDRALIQAGYPQLATALGRKFAEAGEPGTEPASEFHRTGQANLTAG